jgi:hypothetical protein|tara:strand:+ start:14561 stop:14839 length:279 start_codon:yes stop_codon:yes gene_type:complete
MKQFVRVLCDVNCDWTGVPPVYRVYVDDELFAERTWIWTDRYLEEMLQIEALPGEYTISYQLADPATAELSINIRVDFGPGKINGTTLRISA